MANGKIYNASKKKWTTAEEIKAEMFARLDEVGKRKDDWDGKGSKAPSAKTVANAKSILGRFVDEIDAHNSKWIEPSVSKGN